MDYIHSLQNEGQLTPCDMCNARNIHRAKVIRESIKGVAKFNDTSHVLRTAHKVLEAESVSEPLIADCAALLAPYLNEGKEQTLSGKAKHTVHPVIVQKKRVARSLHGCAVEQTDIEVRMLVLSGRFGSDS